MSNSEFHFNPTACYIAECSATAPETTSMLVGLLHPEIQDSINQMRTASFAYQDHKTTGLSNLNAGTTGIKRQETVPSLI